MVRGIITKGSESAALHKKLVVDARDILLDKPRHGAFQSTDLELILRSRGIDTVIISGVATSVCCETTAREAVARDFHVFFLSDGTATADMPGASAAELQKATLATLGFLFAQVLTVDEMMQKIWQAMRTAAGRERRATGGQVVGAAAGGEQATVADPDEALRQDGQ